MQGYPIDDRQRSSLAPSWCEGQIIGSSAVYKEHILCHSRVYIIFMHFNHLFLLFVLLSTSNHEPLPRRSSPSEPHNDRPSQPGARPSPSSVYSPPMPKLHLMWLFSVPGSSRDGVSIYKAQLSHHCRLSAFLLHSNKSRSKPENGARPCLTRLNLEPATRETEKKEASGLCFRAANCHERYPEIIS